MLLLLTDGQRVLLALREGTGYADGQWNLPSGKLEHGEDAVSAVIREAREEIGVRLDQGEPRMVATVHHRNTAGFARVGLVFTVAYEPDRHGEPVNAEPHKCSEIAWHDLDGLPGDVVSYIRTGLDAHDHGTTFSLDGWD